MAETARENQVSSAAVKYETVADMGSGLVIAKVKLTDFREQDINARIMKTEMQKQLTDNIKKRGQLESLPFCALIDGKPSRSTSSLPTSRTPALPSTP